MKKLYWLMALILLLGLALSACGGNNAAVAEPDVVENTANNNANMEEEVVEEPVEEEVVEEPTAADFDVAALDAAYETFLADMEGYNTITLDALNTALVEDPPFILDVRGESELEGSGYIEGAVLIPLRELADNLAYLPSFDTQIVSYCGSGWRCTIALTYLEAMGWEDVKGLKGGSFGGWMEAGYAYEEGVPAEAEMLDAAEVDPAMAAYFSDVLMNVVPDGWGVVTAESLNTMLVENPDLVVIDVRTTGEVEEKGTIDAANWMNIPLQDFVANKADWPADLDAPIVVYCGSGHRSTIAAAILWSYGYTDVGSLKGGFGGWAGEGYPVMGGAFDLDGAYSVFLADMEGYNTITLDALNTALVENPPFILDVRNASELEDGGHIEGAVLIPLNDLAESTAYLPSYDTTIVSYCGSGWRCTIALTYLEAMGWEDVKGLKGGSFGGWMEAGYAYEEGVPAEAEMLNAVTISDSTAMLFDDAVEDISEIGGWGGISADDLNLALIDNPDLTLIDVRKVSELEENGVIESGDWTNIPLEELVNMKADWPEDKDAPIVVYCGSGHRSTIAMAMLYSYGYTNVKSLKGGFNGGWVAAGYPVAEFVAP